MEKEAHLNNGQIQFNNPMQIECSSVFDTVYENSGSEIR